MISARGKKITLWSIVWFDLITLSLPTVIILGQLWPVGVGLCIINLPFMIWAVSATVNALDDELENAAANCGAPPLQAFLTVTLPAVMPGVISGALLMFILAFNEFLVSLFLTDARMVTLPVSTTTPSAVS